ncbi:MULTISPECIES: FtsB family cell division protein [Cocleimonas]|jgi:cell division protein FtsB|uniref:Cell division protein FtsB n=1 Tax=Cocleimonas flava TaxID=634765 RepID=A0A4R1EXG9_9GAMM|nr:MULTISPECIES: septum formation initiator family protein [Cocleimonas]MEB8433940.1 septum formation initiator family protein [Cocleimonas sp. KMM 6892]MEC4716751.1 septum formation initiator family protein [Cocleimonas sp. KMM 6895]MEC4746094.1 septum formation initiator family protein [Cocleimonas sp. KMM 6896]TCJ84732.1 cell division protein FtsB [Cocleimonas flava]
MKALLIIFSLLLVLLLAGLWVGPGSYPHLWKLENRKVVQEQSNAEKKEQIRKIQAELDDVASGKDALEERARSELGMTKKGETFFEVVLQPEPKKKSENVKGEAEDGAEKDSTTKHSGNDSSSIDIKTGND